MFSGRVSAEVLAGGFVVQTETYLHEAGPELDGSVPLEMDRWPIVGVRLPDGKRHDFIVDIGAGGTVIDRSIVPSDLEITEASMVEYSEAGKRTLKYAPGGAVGQAQNIVGQVRLEQIELGELPVADVTVDVMQSLPDIFGRPIGGILGMNVLRRCARLTLALGGESPHISFRGSSGVPSSGEAPSVPVRPDEIREGADRAAGGSIALPFSFVSTHVVIEGDANGVPLFFILDSGAPSVFLDESAADAAGVEWRAGEADSARGLGEGQVALHAASVAALSLASETFRDVPCRVSALSPFDAIRTEDQHAGLLGNDFLERFDSIEIDFENRTVRFVR
jgi:predicted aspartyl protease